MPETTVLTRVSTKNWMDLSFVRSEEAVAFLLENPDKIQFDGLSSNSNPKAVKYLMNHKDKINYNYLKLYKLNYI